MIKKNNFTILTICLVVATGIFLSYGVASSEIKGKDLKYFSNTMKSGDFLGKAHGDLGMECKDCHIKGLPKSVNDAENEKIGSELCIKCHEFEDINKKVIFKYKGNEVLPHSEHTSESNCTDCHRMHEESIMICAECHVQPWMKNLPSRWKQIN